MTETKRKEFSFIVSMYNVNKVHLNTKDESGEPLKTSNRAVAIIGDRFYKGAFLPAIELEKAYKGWENTLHDISHMGTTHIQGLTATSDILYFIGYNKNVSYDNQTKAVSMDIIHKEDTHYGKAWKAYVDLVTEAGGVPNVSVNFAADTKRVQAKDLQGVNYADYGLKPTDYVDYIYDIEPGALSTVFKGACSDANGCGIGIQHSSCECESSEETDEEETTIDIEKQDEERQALIAWLKKYEEV